MVLKSLVAAFYNTLSRFLVVPGLVLDLSDHLLSLLFISILFAILFKVHPRCQSILALRRPGRRSQRLVI